LSDSRPELWTIHTDVQITRRKMFHIVTNPGGHRVFQDRRFHACVDFVQANAQVEFYVRPAYETAGKPRFVAILKQEIE
jgi:hypothetical protein